MESLVHCIYASAAIEPFDARALDELLQLSRATNEAAGVTGMLLHSRGSFFQVLEGRHRAVEDTFDRIYADPRHREITQIIFEPIAQRTFADWTMGYADTSEAEIATAIGSNDFFGGRSCLASLNDGRARRLLEAFAKGRWRTRLSDSSPAQARSA